MGKTLLMCDSTCDLSFELQEKYGIAILNCPVEIDSVPYREREEIESEQIYRYVEESGKLPHSSQITVIEFLDSFVQAAKEGYTDIICVTMNAMGSGTNSAARHAVTLLSQEYPMFSETINIRVIDSGTYALAMGWPIVRAAQKLEKGGSADEVAEFLESCYRNQITLVGLLGITYAKKSGRLNACVAVVGDALGIKPVMAINGENRVAGKARGDKNLIAKMADMYMELAEDPKGDYIVAYGDNPEQGKELAAAIKKRGGASPFIIGPIGPCVAINAGPKMLGLGFRKKTQ